MNVELKTALEELEKNIQGKSQKEVKSAIDAAKSEFEALVSKDRDAVKLEVKNEFDAEIKKLTDALEEKQKHLDALDVRLKKRATEAKLDPSQVGYAQYKNAMVEALTAKAKEISMVNKGRNAELEIKDMTLGGNLTGDSVLTYQAGAVALPSQKVNFADLVPSVNSATGTYVIYREQAPTGAPATQTEGLDKAGVDFNLVQVTYNADYIAGVTRFSKQMATDLPFLTSFLPPAMRREYYKVENSQFFTALRAEATLSASAQTEEIERLIADIGALEAADEDVTGIVLNPADWATIANTKPSDYSLPSVVQYVNGTLVVHGVPVYKASWMPANEYIVGDWSMAKKVIVDGMQVEFFEQDRDNVPKNLVTARIESRTVLAIDRPSAFLRGLLTGAQA